MGRTSAAALDEFAQQHDAARKEAHGLKAQLQLVTSERDRLLRQLGVIESIESATKPKAPQWLAPKTPAKGHHAMLNLLLTDTHFDEVVNPDEVHGINAYNREIAEMRLEKWCRSSINLARNYLSGVTYDGLCLMLGGDIFSGNIHEELIRTNEATLFASLMHWLGPMQAAIELLAKEFGRVHISGVPGNHGRMTRKPIMKQRAADNLDWLFYSLLQRDMRKDDRITWTIPHAPSLHVKVYETRYYMEHGDEFKGGSGISGALAPLMLGTHRTNVQQTFAGKTFDYMVLGHWHQHMFLAEQGLIVGGAMKGFDEYAQNKIKAKPLPPSQPIWITTPENGVGWENRVLVQDREREGW